MNVSTPKITNFTHLASKVMTHPTIHPQIDALNNTPLNTIPTV